MVWEILTEHIQEEICYSLKFPGLFSEEQKRSSKGTKGTNDLLYIYIPAHPQECPNGMEKCSYSMDGQQKGFDVVL